MYTPGLNTEIVQRIKKLYNAEMDGLTSREREETSQRKVEGDGDGQACVLLLERDQDMQGALVHPWHYAALVKDLFGIEDRTLRFLRS